MMKTTYYYSGNPCSEAKAKEKFIAYAEAMGHCEDDIICLWNMRNLMEEARESVHELSGYMVEIVVGG